MPMKSKFAYFGLPHIGGPYTVYRQLREGLKAHGIEVRWIGLGAKADEVLSNSAWSHEWANGEALATDTLAEPKRAELLHATIICGHIIGAYAFIGAGAVASKDIPDHAFPARIIGWMCSCGVKIHFEGKEGVCTECKKKFWDYRTHIKALD